MSQMEAAGALPNQDDEDVDRPVAVATDASSARSVDDSCHCFHRPFGSKMMSLLCEKFMEHLLAMLREENLDAMAWPDAEPTQ